MPPKKDKMKAVTDRAKASKATTSAFTATDAAASVDAIPTVAYRAWRDPNSRGGKMRLKTIMPIELMKPKMVRSSSRPDS
jgi:hypothetical protein